MSPDELEAVTRRDRDRDRDDGNRRLGRNVVSDDQDDLGLPSELVAIVDALVDAIVEVNGGASDDGRRQAREQLAAYVVAFLGDGSTDAARDDEQVFKARFTAAQCRDAWARRDAFGTPGGSVGAPKIAVKKTRGRR